MVLLSKKIVAGVLIFGTGWGMCGANGDDLPGPFRTAPPVAKLDKGSRWIIRETWQFGNTADGGVFIIDGNSGYALWYRSDAASGEWKNVVKNVNLVKTMGGNLPRLHCVYVGNQRFLYAETVSGSTSNRSGDGDPETELLAVTKLVDSNGGVVAQSEAYRYSGSPRIAIPTRWLREFGLLNIRTVNVDRTKDGLPVPLEDGAGKMTNSQTSSPQPANGMNPRANQ